MPGGEKRLSGPFCMQGKDRSMHILGLTGGIACGKSTVSLTLSALGAVIVDGDQLSRTLTAPGGEALPKLRENFGDDIFLQDGTLNRRALGNLVFQHPEEKAKLDALMQPPIDALTRKKINEARESSASICVLDMPLLYEFGYEKLCNRVWCVALPQETQIQRLMERDGMTREAALDRIHSQMPTEEKAARADVVIDTSGTIEETQAVVRKLFEAEMTFA